MRVAVPAIVPVALVGEGARTVTDSGLTVGFAQRLVAASVAWQESARLPVPVQLVNSNWLNGVTNAKVNRDRERINNRRIISLSILRMMFF